jgi:hypothetical protein
VATVIEPLDVSGWAARIMAAPSGVIQFAGMAVDNQKAINEGPKMSPAAFVLMPSYRSMGTPNASGLIIQNLRYLVPVMIAVRNYADPRGERASKESAAARKQVWQQLVGWNCGNPNGFAVEVESGRFVAHKDQHFYYLDVYALRMRISNQES